MAAIWCIRDVKNLQILAAELELVVTLVGLQWYHSTTAYMQYYPAPTNVDSSEWRKIILLYSNGNHFDLIMRKEDADVRQLARGGPWLEVRSSRPTGTRGGFYI